MKREEEGADPICRNDPEGASHKSEAFPSSTSGKPNQWSIITNYCPPCQRALQAEFGSITPRHAVRERIVA
jgi:hypothetical protein